MVTRYTGRSATPRRENVVYRCVCGERFAAEVWRVIVAQDGELRRRLIEGDLNRVRCPACDAAADVQVTVLYHDPVERRLIYVAPPSDRHRELALRAELYAMLAADAAPPPDYVLAAEVVFGSAGLSERLAVAAQAAPPARATVSAAMAEADAAEEPVAEPTVTHGTVPDLEAVLAAARAHQHEGGVPAPATSKAAPRDVTQPRVTVPDPRTAVIERWIAAREGETALFVDDRVVVCAALGANTLESFVSKGGAKVTISLRPQLHRMQTFPLLVLTFVAGSREGQRPDEGRVLHVPLDLSRAAHRVALDQLQRRCAVELELFDSEYLPVVSLAVTAPLEEHVRHLVTEARAALDKLPGATRSFERARSAFSSSSYDRLGRTPIELPSLEDVGRASPAQLRGALQAVARWSEVAAESYLLEIRAYPLPVWRRLGALVVKRAVEIGLFVARGLAERIARRSAGGPEQLDLPPWPELVELLIRRFAELSAKLRPSDLSPSEEAANWELLLREAEQHGVVVEEAVRRLAEAAFERAGGRPSRSARPGGQRGRAPAAVGPRPMRSGASALIAVPTAELLLLLDDRDRRLEAAIAIARRREVPTLPALFGVLRRMSRVEANALLPTLAAFGAPAERWLIEGLRSKKAFMRQGCALALGRVGTASSIEAVVRLLFAEPTEIWTEVARAIGDVGASAVAPLAARLREVDGDVRDRAVQALAHIAARSADGGPAANRAAVEAMATGRDPLLANMARRALVLAPEVRSAHHAVKEERREHTIVRAFTRRFYDALDGDYDVLDSDELEAIEEEMLELAELDGDELDEEDLLEADSEPGLPPPAPVSPAVSRRPPGT